MDVEETVSAVAWKRARGAGYTLNEFLVAATVLLIILGMATPGFLRVRAQGKNEAAAITLLRTVASSQAAYAESCGNGSYAATFSVIDKTGASFQQDGYDFALRAEAGSTAGPRDCHGMSTHTAYIVTAQPTLFGDTGRRSFSVTNSKTIWEADAAIAPSSPFAAPAAPLR